MKQKIVAALLGAALAAGIGAQPAWSQAADNAPPADAKKLSEIIAKVEQRDGFRYIDDIEWQDGAYEVTYHTLDKAKVEIRFDPATGAPQ